MNVSKYVHVTTRGDTVYIQLGTDKPDESAIDTLEKIKKILESRHPYNKAYFFQGSTQTPFSTEHEFYKFLTLRAYHVKAEYITKVSSRWLSKKIHKSTINQINELYNTIVILSGIQVPSLHTLPVLPLEHIFSYLSLEDLTRLKRAIKIESVPMFKEAYQNGIIIKALKIGYKIKAEEMGIVDLVFLKNIFADTDKHIDKFIYYMIRFLKKIIADEERLGESLHTPSCREILNSNDFNFKKEAFFNFVYLYSSILNYFLYWDFNELHKFFIFKGLSPNFTDKDKLELTLMMGRDYTPHIERFKCLREEEVIPYLEFMGNLGQKLFIDELERRGLKRNVGNG